MDKNTFFAEYKLCESDLMEANITWDELTRIEEEYCGMERSLREIGKSFIDNFNELIDASIAYLRDEDFVLYPDFRTGGMIDVRSYNDGERGCKVGV